MSENPVRRDDHGPVVVLTLNRPDRRNALSRRLVTALSDALDRLTVESGPRVLVLAGAGPTFCAGMDLKEAMERGPDGADEEGVVKDIQAIADLISQLHRFPRPTIAALDGDALAGGAGLALACDFVLARAGARVGYPEVRRGMVAAIVLHDLVRQVGDRRARELLLTGEPIGAEQAERWGLINRVVPGESCLPAALELARTLLGSAPQALATTKQLIDEATGRPADLRGAAAVSAAVRVADEAGEGIRAFLEKRPPLWSAGPSPSRIAGDRHRDAGIDIRLQNFGARDPGPAPGA